MNLCSNKEEKAKTWKSLAEYLLCARTTENYIYVWILHAIYHEPIIKKHIKKALHMDKKMHRISILVSEVQ